MDEEPFLWNIGKSKPFKNLDRLQKVLGQKEIF